MKEPVIIGSPFKMAACVFIKNEKGLYLALKREDGKGYGFPGGKRDPGEMLVHTAVREAFEETGHVVVCDKSVEPFGKLCTNHHVLTYKADIVAIGEATHSHEGETVWVTKEQLIDESAFSEYNKECFKHFGE